MNSEWQDVWDKWLCYDDSGNGYSRNGNKMAEKKEYKGNRVWGTIRELGMQNPKKP